MIQNATTSPRVSVIIPAYNARGFIRDALASVQSQTFQDIETIVVDDGSTDGTYDIVTAEYPSVRCIRIAHGGAAKARNAGILASTGEFVAFLDADDLWLPQKLEKQLAAMADPAVGMCATESVYSEGTRPPTARTYKKRDLMEGDIVRNIFSKSGFGTPTVMVRRSVLDMVGYFEEGLVCAEDDNLWMRIAMRSEVRLIEEPLAWVRARRNSLSATSGNIFSGVKAHLALLEIKYPELNERLGALVKKKHAILHTKRGFELMSKDDPRRARAEFAQALRYSANVTALLYWFVTFLPIFLYPPLRRVNRLLRKRVLGLMRV